MKLNLGDKVDLIKLSIDTCPR